MCCLLLIKVLKLADREWSRFQLKGLAHWKGQLSCDPALIARVGMRTLEAFLILFLLVIVKESSRTSMCCKRRQNKLSVHLRHHNVRIRWKQQPEEILTPKLLVQPKQNGFHRYWSFSLIAFSCCLLHEAVRRTGLPRRQIKCHHKKYISVNVVAVQKTHEILMLSSFLMLMFLYKEKEKPIQKSRINEYLDLHVLYFSNAYT